MNRQAQREVSCKYLSGERFAGHHFCSLNTFLRRDMIDVVEEKATIEANVDDKGGEELVYVELDGVRVEASRIREVDGSEELLFSQETRLRSIIYSTLVFMEMSIVRGGEEGEKVIIDAAETKVGRMPIMVGSSKCSITELFGEDLIEIGEDPVDPGGYFIANGSKRVLTTSKDLASNKILAEYDMKYDDEIQVAETPSQHRDYRTLVLCEHNREGLLEASFPSASGSVNFITFVHTLGLEPDGEIIHRVSDDPEIVKLMLENLEEAEVQTQGQVIEVLGKCVAGGQGKDYQFKCASYVINRHLFPHFRREDAEEEEVRMNKTCYPCRMAEVCFGLALQRRDFDNKDHYANKCPKVSGGLMKDLFRTTFDKLVCNVKYQLGRADMWSRNLVVDTVIRSDVLTKRFEHPIATGNWVGDCSGVSQLVDRTGYMGMLSHLRHLRSPLSRSQSYFKVCDLHAARWGRICPSETPKGSNCGLVKNFVQAMGLFQNVRDEQPLKQGFASMDVEGILSIDSVDAAPADD